MSGFKLLNMNQHSFNEFILRLWRAAHSLGSCNSIEEDHESEESNSSTENAELNRVNRALWKRTEEPPRENISITEESAELKKKNEFAPLLVR